MKIERLISMIYMLLNHEVISASELAEKYQVSQRTVYRDIEAICAAGIPVVSYQGANGGYGIMETYKLDKSLLNSFDVETLLTMLNSLSKVFVDEQTMDTVRKLQTVRREGAGQGLILDMESQTAPKESLRLLKSAIKAGKVIHFEYIDIKGDRTSRTVEPVCLIYKNHTWYLYGYCRIRKDYREFRLSRIEKLLAMQEAFLRQHEMPEHVRKANEWPERENPVDVRLRFSPRSLAKALDYFQDNEKTYHEDGSLTITLHLSFQEDAKWLVPMIAGFGEDAEIEEPIAWRSQIKRMLMKTLQKYADDVE